MRPTRTRMWLLSVLVIAAGGCSGQQWAHLGDPFGRYGSALAFRQLPPGSTDSPGVIIKDRARASGRNYRSIARGGGQPRLAVAGSAAWQAPGTNRHWRYIVIHHSATRRGNAQQFDVAHRNRGWDELGYHFVIDNGYGGPDGRVEVGSRWAKQKHGAHTGGTPNNEYNELGIGICLVGDFTGRMPSSAQLAALKRLVAYLAARYNIPPENVITHRDAPGADTDCPGAMFHAYVHHGLKTSLQAQLASACPAWRGPTGRVALTAR